MSVTHVDKDFDTLTLTLVADFDAPIERVWQCARSSTPQSTCSSWTAWVRSRSSSRPSARWTPCSSTDRQHRYGGGKWEQYTCTSS
jgi:hypothetical protein